jgi:hypothetical protein
MEPYGSFSFKEENIMNIIDLLLNTDKSKLQLPKKEVEIKRLSEAAGDKVIFKLEAIDMNTYTDIAQQEKEIGDSRVFAILEGVKEPNLKDDRLLKKYECITPKELVKKMLLPGEIAGLYDEITSLSGFGDSISEVVEEVKK